MTDDQVPDELAARIRSLEAERLRPVPPAGRAPSTEEPTAPVDELVARRARRPAQSAPSTGPALKALRAAGQKHRQIAKQQQNGG